MDCTDLPDIFADILTRVLADIFLAFSSLLSVGIEVLGRQDRRFSWKVGRKK